MSREIISKAKDVQLAIETGFTVPQECEELLFLSNSFRLRGVMDCAAFRLADLCETSHRFKVRMTRYLVQITNITANHAGTPPTATGTAVGAVNELPAYQAPLLLLD